MLDDQLFRRILHKAGLKENAALLLQDDLRSEYFKHFYMRKIEFKSLESISSEKSVFC